MVFMRNYGEKIQNLITQIQPCIVTNIFRKDVSLYTHQANRSVLCYQRVTLNIVTSILLIEVLSRAQTFYSHMQVKLPKLHSSLCLHGNQSLDLCCFFPLSLSSTSVLHLNKLNSVIAISSLDFIAMQYMQYFFCFFQRL